MIKTQIKKKSSKITKTFSVENRINTSKKHYDNDALKPTDYIIIDSLEFSDDNLTLATRKYVAHTIKNNFCTKDYIAELLHNVFTTYAKKLNNDDRNNIITTAKHAFLLKKIGVFATTPEKKI